MTKPLTMKDIAKLAGVSQPTVSRVINDNKDVNGDIAKKVLKVIEDVGYVPNKTARALKQNQSKLIGISVSEMYNPYFVELIDHAETISRKRGYNIILHNAKHNPILEWDNIQNFNMRQVDGCIVVPTGTYNLQRLAKLQIPVVAITQSVEELDSVAVDHKQAGKLIAQAFLKQGHRNFGYIGTRNDEKFIGYEHELKLNGKECEAECFIELKTSTSDHLAIRQSLEKYLEQHKQFPFTAVFAENDIIAVELNRLAVEKGILIPNQLSIIGFDDTYFAKLLGISSIHQPINEMVSTAIQLLIDRMEKRVIGESVTIQLEPMLIERASSNYKVE